MAQALKEIYHEAFLRSFGATLQAASPLFEADSFVSEILKEPWESLELRARMGKITEVLGIYLPSDYEAAIAVLFQVDEHCIGFPYLFFPDFVAAFGQDEKHWELSMNALERFTQRSSSEFAIRPFLLKAPQRVMEKMLQWTKHPNEHVRRLASEGCRPRLPWGVSLPPFKRDPMPVLAVLEALRADPSLYVRKSVANNLNDIAKDHPDLVLETAARWQGTHPHTDWIIRQGCRTLIRKAHPKALALFGYAGQAAERVRYASLSVQTEAVTIGQSCRLEYEIHLFQGEAVRLRIEYGIDFVKARGKISRKLFLLSDKTVSGGSRLTGARNHSWADLTTRRHYSGEHQIVLLVNGVKVGQTAIMVKTIDQ